MADESTEQPEDHAELTEQAAETSAAEDSPREPDQETSGQPVEPVAEQPSAVVAEEVVAEEAEEVEEAKEVVAEAVAEEVVAEEAVAVEGTISESVVEEPSSEQPVVEEPLAEQPADEDEDEPEEQPIPRVKPSVPGAHLEVDIVPEGVDPLAPERPEDPYAIEDDEEPKSEEETDPGKLAEPISTAAIDLAAGARYKATGKRKTAIARVVLRPGSGTYVVNGRALDEHFPRVTLQRNIRQPLETVGYQERMDVVARLHGGGISAQAGALRHGISRALLEADPNLRGELKRRGFLTRDSRAKERKKAGLKKARKRPQFSKR
jgi:small subunit ribosomal protein S9